jgi:ribosome-associated protein
LLRVGCKFPATAGLFPEQQEAQNLLDPMKIVNLTLNALAEKKATNLLVLDLRGLTVIADYFVIATASSPANSRAQVDSVLEETRQAGIKGISPEGQGDAAWVLLDLGDVIVHIFDVEHRDFYHLERLWSDAPQIAVPEELQA